MNHELSTLITAVRGLLETALNAGDISKSLVEKALVRICDMEKIVGSIRLLVSFECQRSKLQEKVDLKSVLKDVIEDPKGDIERCP